MNKMLLAAIFLASLSFANDLEQIKQSKTIRIGVRLSQPPFSKLNPNTQTFEGFEVELAKKIGHSIVGDDGKVELIGVNAPDRIPLLEQNRADLMVANFTVTPERSKKVEFSAPYLSNSMAVISKKENPIKTIQDLKESKVLVIPKTTSDDYIQHQRGFSSIVACDNSKDCHEKLRDGQGDAYFHTNILNAYLTIVDNDLEMSIKSVGKPDFISVAANKNNKSLINAVNTEILRLSKNGFFQEAYANTLEPFYKGAIPKEYLLLDSLYATFF